MYRDTGKYNNTFRPMEGNVSEFLFVCVSCDSGSRNYSISLKFDTNIYVLCESSFMAFGLHCVYRDTQKYLNTLRLKKENSLKTVLTWYNRQVKSDCRSVRCCIGLKKFFVLLFFV